LIIESFTPLGAFIGTAYVLVIASIFTWMLRVPKAGAVEQHISRITREAGRFSRIVVPVQGDFLSDRLVALASQMAKFRGATMDVLYVIEVPLSLPINASMENQERSSEQAFERAGKIASKYDVKINRRVERARQAGPNIVRYARDNNADLLLMGDEPKGNKRGGTKFARSVEYVFENAPCEVLIDRPPIDPPR